MSLFRLAWSEWKAFEATSVSEDATHLSLRTLGTSFVQHLAGKLDARLRRAAEGKDSAPWRRTGTTTKALRATSSGAMVYTHFLA